MTACPANDAPYVHRMTGRSRFCPCGTTRHDRHAVPECDYSFLGNLYAAWGGTAIPTRVSFRCIKCDALFDSTKDLRVRHANK